MINFVAMGAFLKKSRRNVKITQESAAEMAKVSVETIRNIEHGQTIPNMATIFALWDAYGLPIENIWEFYTRDPSIDICIRIINQKYKNKKERMIILR